MFSNAERQKERTGKYGTSRDEFLQVQFKAACSPLLLFCSCIVCLFVCFGFSLSLSLFIFEEKLSRAYIRHACVVGLGRNPPSWEFWCLLPPHAFVLGFVEGSSSSSSSSSSWHCIVRVFSHNSCEWFPRIFQMNSGRGKLFCKYHKTVALVQDLIAISKHPEILGFTLSYLMSPIQDQLSKSVMNFILFLHQSITTLVWHFVHISDSLVLQRS